MRLGDRIDVIDLAKRAFLVNRVDVLKRIMRGVEKRFKLKPKYAWLNPLINDTTDYILICYDSRGSRVVVFHAISFGECSTIQYDLYASEGNIDAFYNDCMISHAFSFPEVMFDALIRQSGLSLDKRSDKYWASDSKETNGILMKTLENELPGLSHKKESKR